MMRKILFDSSVYISAWRERRTDVLLSRAWGGAAIYLSTVVGSELLRGAGDLADQRAFRKLWRDFQKARRLVVPDASDWNDVGVVLGRIGKKYGYETIGKAKLVHDALISLSARGQGITIVTFNLADFERISEFRPISLRAASDLVE